MIIALVGIPLVFTMTVWVVVTSIRIWNPEKELPLERSAERLRKLRLRSSASLHLRLEDIRELERDKQRSGVGTDPGRIDSGLLAWHEELESRRN